MRTETTFETLTNLEMERRMAILKPLLKHADMIGYAAAKNQRKLSDQNKEYQDQKAELIKKYGKANADGESVTISPDMDGWDSFVEELTPYADLTHQVEVFRIPTEQSIGLISGEEILALDWMLSDELDGDDPDA